MAYMECLGKMSIWVPSSTKESKGACTGPSRRRARPTLVQVNDLQMPQTPWKHISRKSCPKYQQLHPPSRGCLHLSKFSRLTCLKVELLHQLFVHPFPWSLRSSFQTHYGPRSAGAAIWSTLLIQYRTEWPAANRTASLLAYISFCHESDHLFVRFLVEFCLHLPTLQNFLEFIK